MTLRPNKLLYKLAISLILLLVFGPLQALPQSSSGEFDQPGYRPVSTDLPAIEAEGAEAWLVTFGPGQAYWERFGHNAIWLREPAAGLDHTFNFGFFDFEQEDFFLRFIRGKMMYFSVAQPAARDFEFYQQQDRSIRLQKLKLDSVQYLRLRDYLLAEIKPENRNYHYDYYYNNCSTRIRDAIDIAFGGEFGHVTKNIPADMNFRQQTRRLTESQYWYYAGLEMGLGFPVDQAISRWDEMFIPMVVAEEVSSSTLSAGEVMVSQDIQLYTSTLPQPPVVPTAVWLRYLMGGLLLAGLYFFAVRFMSRRWAGRLSLLWALLLTAGGLVLSFLWLFTDHSVAVNNANVLLLNPLLILAVFPPLRRPSAVLLLVGVVVSAILLVLPRHQYNIDVWMLLAPMSLAVAIYWLRYQTK